MPRSAAAPVLSGNPRPGVPAQTRVQEWPWSKVVRYVNQTWELDDTPHHSIIGQTRSGKSYLMLNGILKPLCQEDRVLILDTKNGSGRGDKLLTKFGRPVAELPKQTWWTTRRREPMDSWFRLVVHDQFNREGHVKAKAQVYRALERVHNEGNWIIASDETQDITGRQNLGLYMQMDALYRKGASNGVGILATTQAPRNVCTSFNDQCAFFWIGRLRDEQKQDRLGEIGGVAKVDQAAVRGLKQREWLLSAEGGDLLIKTRVE